jgi:hypothetical protein
MATINVKDAVGATVALEKPLVPGQAAMAASRPVVVASDQSAVPVSLASVPSHAVTNAGTFATQAAATLAAETTKVIGVVRTADGSGNLLTSTANAVDVNIKSGVNANGQATMANSAPVVLASNQSSIPVTVASTTITGTVAATQSGTWSANLLAATSGGLTRSRTLIPNNTTAVVVKSGAGQLYKVRCTNNSAVIAYLKIYDATSATAGSGTPVDTIMIPANTSGAGIVDSSDVGTPFATGLTFIVTTGIADADTAVPAANAYIVTLYYK